MVFSIDHHIVIGVTLFGMVVDVLGGLFLAYDLLGGRKGPLRTLTRGITYLILCVSLSLCGVAVAFPIAIEFHFSILSKFGTSGTFGLLLGYMIGWGTGTAVGYLFTTPYAKAPNTKTPKIERPKHRFKKAGKFGGWFLLWLIPWLVETLIFTSRNEKSLWRKVVPIIGYSVVAGFLLGFIIRKLFEPEIIQNYQQETIMINNKLDVIDEPIGTQVNQFKVRTRRFRIVSGFGVGFVMGFLFWLGALITIEFKLVHNFASGMLVGLVLGLINGFVFGFLVRLFLIKIVDVDSPIKPNIELFDSVVGMVVAFTTAFIYGIVIWFFFGGNFIILLLTGSLLGLLGGVGGGFFLCVIPFLEWKVYSLPPKILGTIGAIMIVLGFIIQTIQYWINLLDIHLK